MLTLFGPALLKEKVADACKRTHLHSHTCAHLRTDTHIYTIHLHPLMQPTTHMKYKVNSNKHWSRGLKGHHWRDLVLIQLFLLGDEPVGLSLAV